MTEKAKNKDMKTRKLLISIGIISLLAVFIVMPSCKKDDTSNVTTVDTTATLSFLSNGSAVTATMGRNTLSYVAEAGHIGRILNIVAQSGTNQLTLLAKCWDFQNPPMGGFKVKKYFANPLYCTTMTFPGPILLSDMGSAIWQVAAKTYMYSPSANNSEFVEITACNTSSKKISGSFKFTVKEMSNASDSLIISGAFANQPYIVVNK